jgi:hypothetical protein
MKIKIRKMIRSRIRIKIRMIGNVVCVLRCLPLSITRRWSHLGEECHAHLSAHLDGSKKNRLRTVACTVRNSLNSQIRHGSLSFAHDERRCSKGRLRNSIENSLANRFGFT